ncbi:MAG: DeoR family transcriptional regulator, partial [Chloroflexi bacterium]
MIPSQREVFIHNFLERHGSITVADICSYCDCSQETARRDLRRLEENLLLIRTHGGAVPNKTTPSPRTYTNGFGVLEARTALVDRADVLIVSPEDTIAFHTLVERARRANVPIIAEAISYQGAVTTVSVNNYQAGLEAGRWVVEFAQRHGGGETAVLDITHPMPNTSARSRGFADGLRSLPAAKRTIFQVNGQGLRETARDIAADVLSVHPEINVIFGINDDSALGALDAYRAAGLDESRLLVVSFGLEGMATKTLLKRSGPYMMSIAMFPELVGQACIDAAI